MARASGVEGKNESVVQLPERRTIVEMTKRVARRLRTEKIGSVNEAGRVWKRTFRVRSRDAEKATQEPSTSIDIN